MSAANRTWATSGRESGWRKTVARIKARDGGICTHREDGIRCTFYGTEVDHIRPKFEGGSDDDSNLALMCSKHHGTKTALEGVRAREQKKARWRKQFDRTESHPGLII